MKLAARSLICFLVFSIALFLGPGLGVCQVDKIPNRPGGNVSIKFEKRALGEVFKYLMQKHGLRIGFEESVLDRGHDDYRFSTMMPLAEERPSSEITPGITVSAITERGFSARTHFITLDVKDRDMDYVFDQIVNQMDHYIWKYSDGVYNISPKVGRDERYAKLLETKVKCFRIDSGAPSGQVQYEIYRLPEVAYFLSDSGLSPARVRSTVSLEQLKKPLEAAIADSDLTLLELLNRIVNKKGSGGWVLRQGRKRVGDLSEYIEIDI